MNEFRMPALGAEMEAGTLVEWLKKPGDGLARGDIIAVVDTEKGAIEIEVFQDGVLDRVLVAAGQQVPVGTPLALIRGTTEAPSADLPAPSPITPASVAGAPPPAITVVSAAHRTEAPHHERRASPAARKAAQELHVDLTTVAGSGPGGAITREDVEAAARVGTKTAPAPTDKMAAMRAAIAAAMSRSKREIPHLYESTTIDMTAALAWLGAENSRRSVERRLLPIALLVSAVAKAVGDVPGVNGFWIDGRFAPGAGVHIGCAIALRDGGLVAPALHDADRKPVDAIMTELTELVARARRGTLRSSELSDPTITVTNLGDLGVESTFAVIYPPQVAIVAFGKPTMRAWVVGDRVEPRMVLTATVSADHRAVDGRRAGQFLSAVERWLQKPEAL
ncbi:MAG TPA: dihydrolipoamide acetyltransferase family protein [Vicinamibacterales bacterium]